MSNPTFCTTGQLLGPCYTVPGPINEKQQKALLVLFKIIQLDLLTGTNYLSQLNGNTGVNVTQLIADAQTLCCGMGEPDIKAAQVQLRYNQCVRLNSTYMGQAFPNVIAQMGYANCLVEIDDLLLAQIDLLLDCAIGVGQHPPA